MPSISNLIAYLCAALMVVILILAVWLYVDGARITTLDAQNSALVLANTNFKTAADAQNAAIQKMKDNQTAMTKAAAKAQKQAAKKDSTLQAALTKLAKVKPSKKACEAANALLNQYIGGK